MSQTRLFLRLAIFFTIIALFTAASFYFFPASSQEVLTAAVVSDAPYLEDASQVQSNVFFVNAQGMVEDVGVVFPDGSIQR